jgi:hypothetical protein
MKNLMGKTITVLQHGVKRCTQGPKRRHSGAAEHGQIGMRTIKEAAVVLLIFSFHEIDDEDLVL